MSPKILSVLLLIFIQVKCDDDAKSSLVFVFDTTGSMYNDLKQLREGAEMILKTALEEGNVIGDFVFVPFHDPLVGPATVTQDKEVLKAALERVKVYGGGDCPEKSLGGIQMALDVSQARSYVYVFTDATAGDHRLVSKVLDAVQRKQSQVVFVLTGHCNDLDKPSYKVYHQIAAASSGQVFNLNKTSVHKVLDFVRSSIKGRMVNLGSSVNPAGSNTQEVPVDSTLGEVTVSVSGARPQITVLDPNGTEVTPPQLVTTLDLAEIMVVKVMQPEPGNWTITVGSDEDYSVKVSGLSNLTFNHGFSVEKPRDMAETSYRPLKGTYNHMMISLTQKTPPVIIDFAEILSMNGSTLFELPLTEVDAENKVYLAEAFIPPEEFFYVAINGKDERNQPLKRIGSTAVQAKVPDVPYLTTSRQISAHAHSRVVLKCKVDSLVPLTGMWTKSSHKLQPQISSLQTTSIEYVIEDLTDEKTGLYKCFAKNVAGVGKAATEVSIIVEPPQVSFDPANLTLEVGDNTTLTCTVVSEALLLDFQIASDSPGARSTKINVEPTIDGVYQLNKTIVNASEADAGTYTCSAVNRGGSTNQSATISIASKPTVQIIGPHTISKSYHTTAQLYCQADNCGTVTWMHAGRVVRKSAVGSGMVVLELNVTEDGVWSCVGKRGRFEASDSVEIIVLMKPSVSIAGDKNITVLNGTVFELSCEVTGKPAPRVIWHRETEEFLNHTLTNPKRNTYLSKLTLNSSVENVAATYFCYGENSEGITQDHVLVNVRRGMTVLEGPKDISHQLYSRVKLTCRIDSHPPPITTWYHNGSLLQTTDNIQISIDNTTVVIKRMDFDNLGLYRCGADNGFESVALNSTLGVEGVEMPQIEKEPAKIIANKGDSTLISCRIKAGNPTPTITWQYNTLDNVDELGNGTELSLIATEDSRGLYRCVAKNVLGEDSYEVELVVQYPPTLKSSVSPNSTLSVSAGRSVQMSCEATAAPPPLLLWTRDGRPLRYSNNVYLTEGGLTIDNVGIHNSGKYICNATNAVGSAHKNFTLLVYEEPEISTNNSDALLFEVLEGQLVEMPCDVKGTPKPVVTWEQNGVLVNDDRKFVDEFGIRFIANLTDFGNYTCRAKNQHGSTSIAYLLYVWVPPSIEPPLEMSKDVLLGDDVNIQCDAVGFPIPSMKWAFNEVMVMENTTDISFNDIGNLYITNASSKHEGIYACIAENLAGTDHKFIKLDVNEPPKILEDNYRGPYLATNLDSALTIACKTSGKPKPYVVWSKGDVYLSKDSQYEVGKDATLTIKSPTEDLSGNYTCRAMNKYGAANKTVKVEVYSLPTVQQSDESQIKATVVEHENATVDCPIRASDGDTVKWYKDAELITTGPLKLANVTRKHQATYACVVTNAVASAFSTVHVDVEWPPTFIDNIEGTKDNDHGADTDDTKVKADEVDVEKMDKDHDHGADKDDGKLKADAVDVEKMDKDHEHGADKDDTKLKADAVDVEKVEKDHDHGVDKDDTKLKFDPVVVEKMDKDRDHGADKDDAKLKFHPVVLEKMDKGLDHGADKDDGKLKADTVVVEKLDKHNINDKNETVLNDESLKALGDINGKEGRGKDAMSKKDDVKMKRNGNIKIVEVVKGDDAYLDCQTDAKPMSKIKWLFNSKPIMFQNTSILKLLKVRYRHAGTYKCIAANVHGSVHRVFNLEVLVIPFISEFDVMEVSLTEGSNATLECNAKGYPQPRLRWTYNNTNWHLENASLTTANITQLGEGVFRCDAVNEAGATHIAYAVTVVSAARVGDVVLFDGVKGVSVGKNLEVGIGTHIRVTCNTTGKPAPTVKWLRNGKLLGENIRGVDYADLILDVETSTAGVYTCVAANEGGEDLRSVRVEVLEPPKIIRNRTTKLEVLTGQPYYLHCHALGNPAPQTYWFKDELPLKLFDDTMVMEEYGEVVVSNSAAVEQSGVYKCVQRNRVGNDTLTYQVTVLVPPAQPKDAIKPVRVRVNKPLTLTCPVEGSPAPDVMWIKHPYSEVEASSRVALADDNVTLYINRTQVSDSGNYSCIMGNTAGTAEVVFSVVVVKPPSIAGAGAELEERVVPLRRSVVLKCEPDGHPLPTISWLKDTQKLSPTSSNIHPVLGNSLLAVWSVTSRDAGQYICVAENEAGTAHTRYNLVVQVPGKWSSWGQWSLCNATCGLGQQRRARACQYQDEDDTIFDKASKPDRILVDESACKGPSIDKRKCQMPPCEEEGTWLAWSGWSACSASCGRGTQARSRRCHGDARACAGGDNVQIRKCPDLPKCVADEDVSSNDVFSNEYSKENAYIPEAVFEKEPEIVNSLYSPDVEESYATGGSADSKLFYVVNVTSNLDGSDAGSCRHGYRQTDTACEDIDECSFEINHCHSTQACENTPGGYTCRCPPGYVALGPGQRCMDINECSLDTSGCEFACVNTAGGYACACPSHMRLRRDKHHCYTVSSSRRSYEDLDNSEYLSTSVEHPARYKHIRNS